MALTPEQFQRLKELKMKQQVGTKPTATATPPKQGFFQDAKGDLAGIGRAISGARQRIMNTARNAGQAFRRGEQGVTESLFQVTGAAAGATGDAIFNSGLSVAQAAVPQSVENAVSGTFQKGSEAVVNTRPIQELIQRYQSLSPETKRNVDAALGFSDLIGTVLGGGAAVKAGGKTVRVGSKVAGETIDTVGGIASQGARTVKGGIERVRNITQPLKDRIDIARGVELDEKGIKRLINNRRSNFEEVMNGTNKRRQLLLDTQERYEGWNPLETLASDDRFKPSVTKEGRVVTTDAMRNLQEIANSEAQILRQAIVAEGRTVPLDSLKRRALQNIQKYKNQGAVYNTYRNRIINDFETYKAFTDVEGRIPLERIDEIKKAKYEIVNYDNPENKIADRELARAAKELIEDTTSSTDVRLYNQELGKLYDMRDILDSMDGAVVKGGRLGKYFAGQVGTVTGAFAGSMVGGPAGAIGGGFLGDLVGESIQGQYMRRSNFPGSVGNNRVTPQIVEETNKLLNAPKKQL